MEITLNKTRSRVTDTLEVVNGDYKVIANVAIEESLIKQLNGYVTKIIENTEIISENISWNASKRNDVWGIDFSWLANDKNSEITNLIVAVVNAIVADYEVA